MLDRSGCSHSPRRNNYLGTVKNQPPGRLYTVGSKETSTNVYVSRHAFRSRHFLVLASASDRLRCCHRSRGERRGFLGNLRYLLDHHGSRLPLETPHSYVHQSEPRSHRSARSQLLRHWRSVVICEMVLFSPQSER